MLRHVLLLKPNTDITPEAIDSIRTSLAALVGVIPGLVDFHWGPNLAASDRHAGYSYGFSMDFRDRESLAGYGPHPEHVKAANLVRKHFAPPLVLDFEL
jgi:Stress responsive A/B Barrel Domain